jgi:hypothetical protein
VDSNNKMSSSELTKLLMNISNWGFHFKGAMQCLNIPNWQGEWTFDAIQTWAKDFKGIIDFCLLTCLVIEGLEANIIQLHKTTNPLVSLSKNAKPIDLPVKVTPTVTFHTFKLI